MKQNTKPDYDPSWEKFEKDGSQFISFVPPNPKPSEKMNWVSKIDGEAFQVIAARRLTRNIQRQYSDPPKREELCKVIKAFLPASGERRTVEVSPGLLCLMASAGMSLGPRTPGKQSVDKATANYLENVDMLKEFSDSPHFRQVFSIAGAFFLTILEQLYVDVARQTFGKLDLTSNQMLWTMGTVLRDLGRGFRKERVNFPKGRVNTELLELLRVIRSHQKKKLKNSEVRAALEYAGVHVSDDEALRIFEWRAKKKGQL